MARYDVIKEIGESLAGIVRAEAKKQKVELEVVVGPFDQAFFAKKSAAVALYLYEIGYDHQRQQELREFEVKGEDDQGEYTILYPRPLAVDLRWAVAATARTAGDEHIALAVALKAFYDAPLLDSKTKQGENFPDRDLPIDIDRAFTLEKQAQLLGSLGVPHHALLGYRIATEIRPERELRRTRKVERRSIALFDKHRTPEGMGPDADRKKPAAGGTTRK